MTPRSLCKFDGRMRLPGHFWGEHGGRSFTLSETRGLAAKVHLSCRDECH